MREKIPTHHIAGGISSKISISGCHGSPRPCSCALLHRVPLFLHRGRSPVLARVLFFNTRRILFTFVWEFYQLKTISYAIEADDATFET